MADRGVLIVALAWPEDLTAVLPSQWLGLCEHRLVAPKVFVKCPARNFHEGEDLSERSGREWGIIYVAMEGLTELEMEFCMTASTTCQYSTVGELSRASLLWVKGATLPKQFRGQGDPFQCCLEEAGGLLARPLLVASEVALPGFWLQFLPRTKRAVANAYAPESTSEVALPFWHRLMPRTKKAPTDVEG